MSKLEVSNERERNAINDAYSRLFSTNDGDTVLTDLTAKFHDCPTYVPGGIEGQRETERRAARKEVVAYILARLGKLNEDRA